MPKPNINRKLPTLQVRASFSPESFNEEARTVEMIFGTDNPVRMYDWDLGSFMETMSFDKGHVRWDRLNGGAPLLNNHKSYDGVNGVLGKVEKAWAVNGEGRCIVRFSKRADVEPVFQDVKDGILTGVSFGYRVYKYEKIESLEGELPKMKAIDWEPFEVSLAPIQADANAGVRENNSEDLQEVEIIDLTLQDDSQLDQSKPEPNTRTMTEEEKAAKVAKEAAEAQRKLDAEAATKAAVEAATKAEKVRSTSIIDLCRKHGLDEAFRDELIGDDKVDLAKARELVLEKIAEKDTTLGVRGNAPEVKVGTDREDKMRKEAVSVYLMERSVVMSAEEKKTISADVMNESRKYKGQTALDIAKDSLIRGGVNISGMDSMEIVGRAFTSSTSDFPILLQGSAQATLLSAYEAAPDTWRRFCGVGSVNDFRQYDRLRMGTFTDLETVNENGEFKTKKITDADYEKVQAATKGNIVNVSRKMIINDDLAAFLRISQMLGRSAARSVENDVYALLAENAGLGPNMVDGLPLIDAAHNNIGAAAAPTVDQVDLMRQLMAKQKDKDSNDFLDLRPDLVVCPLSLGSKFRLLNTNTYDPDVTSKFQVSNTVAGIFNDVIDTPRMTGTYYWMFTNPNVNPVIEVSFLNGVQTPFMEMQEGFTVDGTKWKIRLDYGVGAVDYRGVVRSAGA